MTADSGPKPTPGCPSALSTVFITVLSLVPTGIATDTIPLAGNLPGVQSSHLHGISALPAEHGSGLASRLYWLHIPKCGTTFLTSLIDVACPSSWKRWNHGLPVEIFSHVQRDETERERFTASNVAGSGLYPAKWASPNIIARLDLELRAQCQLSPFFTCGSDIGLPFNVSQINRGWLQLGCSIGSGQTAAGNAVQYRQHICNSPRLTSPASW